MTRSQIEYILAVAKTKNFGKAAEECYISQSTLSAMIAKAEEQSGIEIFNRKTRPVSVTPQGESLIKSLKSIFREYQLLEDKINEIKGVELTALSIACIPTVAPYLYPLILNRISRKYKQVHFTIHELTTENIKDELINGSIDVGIVSIPLEHKDLLEYPVYNEEFLIYDCGSKSVAKHYTVSDIDIDRLWLLEEGHCLRNQVGKICELRQLNKMIGNINYNCGSIFTLTEMVKKNKGVTLLPRLALVNNRQLDKKCIFQITEPVPSRTIGLVCHRNFTNQGILLKLVDIIKEAVRRHLPLDNELLTQVKPF